MARLKLRSYGEGGGGGGGGKIKKILYVAEFAPDILNQ